MLSMLWLLGMLVVYFVPSMIGYNKRNFMAILMLNLLLGWTGFGWVAALIWACCVETRESKSRPNNNNWPSLN